MATALSEGESKKKHVVLLEILGEQYRTVNLPLYSVRPFIHESVSACPHNAQTLISDDFRLVATSPLYIADVHGRTAMFVTGSCTMLC